MKIENINILHQGSSPTDLPTEGLGFGRYFTKLIFTQQYDPENGWHKREIKNRSSLDLDPTAQIFHCGQGIFEGIKAFQQADGQVAFFRIEEHLKRFNKSAIRMAMPTIDLDNHLEAIKKLVALEKNWIPSSEGAALYIRPVMIANESTLEVRASNTFMHFILLSPVGPYFGNGLNPVSVYISHDYVRAVQGGTGEAKTIGNYAASLLATENARKDGFQQVLWLDANERRYVEEVGGMNIAFVYGDTHISTPGLTGSILPGVTRDSIAKLSASLGFTFSEDKIDINTLVKDLRSRNVTEVFAMGTGAIIAPVGRLKYMDEEIIVNEQRVGPVSQTLFKALTDIHYGRTSAPTGWLQHLAQ